MIQQIHHVKTWELRKMLTKLNKAQAWAKNNKGGLHRLMIEHNDDELKQIRKELNKRKHQIQPEDN